MGRLKCDHTQLEKESFCYFDGTLGPDRLCPCCLVAEVRRLRGVIERLKPLAIRQHYYCEDCWFSCPKSVDGCCNDAMEKNKCNCGTDAHNQEVEELYKTAEEE